MRLVWLVINGKLNMDIRKEFEQTIVVKQNECDLNNRMRIAALLRAVQQISTDHCTALGVTDEMYRATHSGFLLAKMSVEVYDDIRVGEQLRLLTHPSMAKKAVYPRYTEIFHEDGRLAASVDARWILVDTENRKILRKCPEGLPLDFGNETVDSHDIAIPKIKDAQPVGELTVTYSRTDINRHLNNTEYADIICDHLPLELVSEKAIRKMVLSYHQEIRLGESAAICCKEEEEGWYVCGQLLEKTAFEAWVQFR